MNKAELIKKSEEHQKAIEREFGELAVEGKKIARTTAYVAGGLLASYLVIRLLTRNKSKNSPIVENFKPAAPVKAGIFSGIGKIILTELAMVGIQMAKNRFKDILHDEETDNKTE